MELCSRSAKSIGEVTSRPSARFAHSAVAVPSTSNGKHSTVGSHCSTTCLDALIEGAHVCEAYTEYVSCPLNRMPCQ